MLEATTGSSKTWRWSLAALSMMVVVALMLAVACGGDDEEGEDGADEEATATATEDAGDREGGDGGGDGGDGDGGAELSALTQEYSDFTGSVTYTTTGFDEEGGLSSMTIYQTEGKSRIDIESAEGTVVVISVPDASYLCAENQCIKYAADDPAVGTSAAVFTSFLSSEAVTDSFGDIPEGVEVDSFREEIAGIDASCFRYTGDVDETEPGDESGTVCFSESGLLLEMEFSGASGSGSFQAVEASDEVSDADFEPPFDVVDLTELGQ